MRAVALPAYTVRTAGPNPAVSNTTTRGARPWAPKNEPGDFDAYQKAEPDEPMFTLLGRDSLAASLVRLWAAAREPFALTRKDAAKIKEARQCAAHMEAWCSQQALRPVRDVLSELPLMMLSEELERRGFKVNTKTTT